MAKKRSKRRTTHQKRVAQGKRLGRASRACKGRKGGKRARAKCIRNWFKRH